MYMTEQALFLYSANMTTAATMKYGYLKTANLKLYYPIFAKETTLKRKTTFSECLETTKEKLSNVFIERTTVPEKNNHLPQLPSKEKEYLYPEQCSLHIRERKEKDTIVLIRRRQKIYCF